jgi:hypothetical protein
LSNPQDLKAARVRGLRKAAMSSISCSRSFHSIMVAEYVYKTKIKIHVISHVFYISAKIQKTFLGMKTNAHDIKQRLIILLDHHDLKHSSSNN